MRKRILIIGLLLIALLNSNCTTNVDEVVTKKTNINTISCVQQVAQITTVLTEEESLYLELINKTNIPFVGNSFIGFREALGFKESRSRYNIVNKFGYLGKYQFGKSTLKRFRIYNTTEFLKSSKQQEEAFIALCSLNKHILRKDIKRSVGKKINGVYITESGILAAAHLGGAGNVKKYLRSRGSTNFSDAFGSSIQYYMKKFSGFDVSSIEANKRPIV